MMYYGVRAKGDPGHYLFDNTFRSGPQKERLNRLSDYLIYTLKLDGGFCPSYTKDPGIAKITVTNEFTILSFWDYSGDSRGGSNSNFIEFGRFTYDEMITMAQKVFPSIFQRFNFEITCPQQTDAAKEK